MKNLLSTERMSLLSTERLITFRCRRSIVWPVDKATALEKGAEKERSRHVKPKLALGIGAGIGALLGAVLFDVLTLGAGALGGGIGAALGTFLGGALATILEANRAVLMNPTRRKDR